MSDVTLTPLKGTLVFLTLHWDLPVVQRDVSLTLGEV